MSSRNPPLEYRDIVRGLKALGFTERQQKATGHSHWVKEEGGRFKKVTVSRHLAPFGHRLIKSMAAQAGVSKKDFHRACGK